MQSSFRLRIPTRLTQYFIANGSLRTSFTTRGLIPQLRLVGSLTLPKMEDVAESFEEKLQQEKGKGRLGRGGRRGGGRGGGHGGGGGNRAVMLSKALSKLLRHQAQTAGIQLDREGYAALDQVVS